MITVTCTLVGETPYSQGKAIQSKKETGEGHDAFENRTWRERMHYNKDGEVFIPPMAIKNCLADCAKFLSETVPGKGKATYTKHFEAGIMCSDPAYLGYDYQDVQAQRLFVPADGRKGGSTRVWKNFPTIPEGWEADIVLYVFDPILIANPEKIEEYLIHAGKFIGLGTFRPRRGGFNGRFTVKNFKHE